MSPGNLDNRRNDNEFSISKKDQLFKILSILGTPDDVDKSFITDETAINYVNEMNDNPKIEFESLFPSIPAEGLNFLEKLLQFNPYFRMSVDEALIHPFFDHLYKPELVETTDTSVIKQ